MKDFTDFYAQASVRKAAFTFLSRFFDQGLVEFAQSQTDHPEAFRQLLMQFAETAGLDVSNLPAFQQRLFATHAEILAMPGCLARLVYNATSDTVGLTREELLEAEEEPTTSVQEDEVIHYRPRTIVVMTESASRRLPRRASRQGTTPRRAHHAARFAVAASR